MNQSSTNRAIVIRTTSDLHKPIAIASTIVLIVTTIFTLCQMNKVTNLTFKNGELEVIHKADSTEISRLRMEAGKTMYMMQQGASGKDTVYFQDKNKVKYQILFIKK